MTMHDVWVWLATYPAIWTPILGAILSLVYSALDKTTAGHAALSFVAAVLPLDLPKMKDAASRFVEALAKKNAGPPAAMLVVIALASLSTACSSFFTPKRDHGIEDITMCVLAHKDMAPADVAITCGVQDAQDVVDIITGEQHRAAMAHQAGVNEARSAGCK